jgi:hypothetical protein
VAIQHQWVTCVLLFQVLGWEGLGPLQRLHHQLSLSLQLASRLHTQLGRDIAPQAIRLEMQVTILLHRYILPSVCVDGISVAVA